MITDSFNLSSPIISPADFYGEQKHICQKCIVTFSRIILENVLSSFPCEEIARIGAANGAIPIYAFDWMGERIAIYLTGIGATLAATDVIECNWLTGCTQFIMFGSAGNLNRAKTEGKFVVPTEAYRDEGMSYHYAPPADWISIRQAEKLSQIFDELHIPHVNGRVWTTDAIYRETREQLQKRQADGCLAVEMELAGVQAVCDFHGLELYDFLATGDVLDAPDYSPEGLHDANHNLDKFSIALEIAHRI